MSSSSQSKPSSPKSSSSSPKKAKNINVHNDAVPPDHHHPNLQQQQHETYPFPREYELEMDIRTMDFDSDDFSSLEWDDMYSSSSTEHVGHHEAASAVTDGASGVRRKTKKRKKGKQRRKRRKLEEQSHASTSSLRRGWESDGGGREVFSDAGYGSSEWEQEQEDERRKLRRSKKRSGKPTIPFLDTFFKTFAERMSKKNRVAQSDGSTPFTPTPITPTETTSTIAPGDVNFVQETPPMTVTPVSPTISANVIPPIENLNLAQQQRSEQSLIVMEDAERNDGTNRAPSHGRSISNASSTSALSVHSESDSSTITIAGGLKLVDKHNTFKKHINWGDAATVVDALASTQRERQNLADARPPSPSTALVLLAEKQMTAEEEASDAAKRSKDKVSDGPSVYQMGQQSHVRDLPSDTIILAMSYLEMHDLLSCGVVCRQWKKLFRVNYLWAPFLVQQFGTRALRPPMASTAAQRSDDSRRKKTRKNKAPVLHTASSLQSPQQNTDTKTKPMRTGNNNDAKIHIYLYYTRFKYRKKKKKKMELLRLEREEEEKVRSYYERMLRKPQKWCERIYISFYTPLFFFFAFVTLLLFGLYLDNIIPHGLTIESSRWAMFLTISPYLLIVAPLFFVGAFSAFVADYLKTLRWNCNFDSFSTMIFAGNMWIVIAPWLVIIKNFLLPTNTQWRAAIAPLWVFCAMFVVVSLVLHIKIDRVKFGLDQKITWALLSILNAAVTITTGFIAGKLDGDLSGLYYTSFVFSPMWIAIFIAIVSLCVGGFLFLSGTSWKALFFFYTPTSSAFILPLIPFLFMLGLKMDKIATSLSFVVIFSPLLFWCVIWMIMSIVFGAIVLIKSWKRPEALTA